MQKIKEELISEILWRAKELKNIEFLYENNIHIDVIKIGEIKKEKIINTPASKYILRTAIPLIYAHWEGFFKKSIKLTNIKLDELALDYNKLDNSLLSSLTQDKQAEKFKNTKLLFSDIIINTESNLRWKVLEKFINRYNFNFEKYMKYKNTIEKILAIRNAISHGENSYHFEDISKINEYRIDTLKLMILTKNEVISYLEYKNYYSS